MPFSGSYFGLHMQDPVEEWDLAYAHAFMATRKFRLLKSFHPEDYARCQEASPGTYFIFRPWIDDHSQGDWIAQAALGPAAADAAADDYISRFKDSVNEHMDGNGGVCFVESLNEEYPTHNPVKLSRIVAFDRAFVRRLAVHCPGMRPVVFCAAVGNPDHVEYGALVDLARETAQAGGAFGYHGYWTVYDGHSFADSAEHWRDLQGRWDVIDGYLVGRGIRVNWMIGESGATSANPDGYNPDVIEGWKHSECWGGNEDAYLSDIRTVDRLLSGTLAAREGRLLGSVLFTSRPGDGGVWKWFNVTGSMMWKLAEYVGATASSAPDDPPAPPEPPDGGNGKMLTASEMENLWGISVSAQINKGISLNPGAKLQGAILGDGLTPVLKEKRFVGDDGRLWAYQPAESVSGALPRRVYVCEVLPGPAYGDVFFFTSDGSTGAPAASSAVWAPVGTEAERQAGEVWPGDWGDANPYGSSYILRGRQAYHTGADLNLNVPRWNSDAGAPVYACADGDVVYAGRFNEYWGNVIIVRHAARGGFYARYAHLAEVLVASGDVVFLGELLGTVGGSDVGLPDHLHFDISLTDVLEHNPGDWPGSSLARLQRDYVDPKAFLLASN